MAMTACGEPPPSSETDASSSTVGASTTGEASSSSSGPAFTTSGPTSADGTAGSTSNEPVPDLPYFDVGGVSDMGANSVTCSGDLKQVINVSTGVVVEQCGPDEGCLESQCVPACLAAAGSEGSLGCEFIVPTSPFFANGTPLAAQSGPCHALLVSNPWDRHAELELSRGGMSYGVDAVTRVPDGIAAATTYDPLPAAGVPPGQVAVVFLSHRPGVNNGTSLECPIPPAVSADTAAHGTTQGEAFFLTSDTPVQVYDIIPYGGAPSYLPSASLIYPSTAWGDGYMALSPHPEQGGVQWILAVAREDDTTVQIQPTVPMTPGTIANPPVAGVTQYTFDAGQVLQWQSNADPVGSLLAADKPIGVFTGNTYLRVTTADNPLSGQDSAHQMIPDVNALASAYVGAGLVSRLPGGMAESVLYRLVGVVDGTDLEWDPGPPVGAPSQLDAGEVAEFETREAFAVQSQDDDHAFSLSQYMSGSIDDEGDDEWVMLVPPDQFLRSYAFFVDPTYRTSTLVLVREAGPTGFADVEVACLGTVGDWEPVGNDGQFEYAHVELFRDGVGSVAACETSQHLASSSGSFGVTVWGTDSFASYGYPAGGNLQSINTIDVDPAG